MNIYPGNNEINMNESHEKLNADEPPAILIILLIS
jgi:hypothetical protein